MINDSSVNDMITQLNRFGEFLKNQAIRAGVVSAVKPIEQKLTQLASRYVQDKEPTRHIRGTNIVISRPHLRDAMTTKIWKIPDGSGYVGYAGPVSVLVPHAHWFGDRAPTNRYTKAGKFRGTHLSHKGGPARIFSRAESESLPQAIDNFNTTVTAKINSYN